MSLLVRLLELIPPDGMKFSDIPAELHETLRDAEHRKLVDYRPKSAGVPLNWTERCAQTNPTYWTTDEGNKLKASLCKPASVQVYLPAYAKPAVDRLTFAGKQLAEVEQ